MTHVIPFSYNVPRVHAHVATVVGLKVIINGFLVGESTSQNLAFTLFGICMFANRKTCLRFAVIPISILLLGSDQMSYH